MFDQDTLSAGFKINTLKAADAFIRTKNAHANAKDGLCNRIAEAVVGRLLASDAESVDGASKWVGECIPKDHKAKASSNAYRSAVKWRLDTATVARLRAMVTPEAATDPDAFALIVVAGVETLGDYWADYKRDKKKPAAPAPAPEPAAEAAPETPEPVADPVMAALTKAMAAIEALKALGATDALEMVAEAIATPVADAQAA